METLLPDLPNLKLLRRIGSGATSHVYEGLRETNQQRVAVKIVPIHSFQNESARLRIEREANALQSLRHPNIVRLYQFYKTERDLILELEFIDGCTLSEWMKQNQISLLEPKLWLLSQLAQALAIAHMDGTIHRDLKPENILISKDGELKLTDFGLAKQPGHLKSDVTQPGLIVGSLAYMAPEALIDGKSSFASDVFSFGVVAYELLTNTHPFPHKDVKSLIDAMYNSAQGRHNLTFLSSRLETILLGCLSVNVSDRPSSLWTIYAELMSTIETSGLQDLCIPLASSKAVDGGFLSQALERKHMLLKNSIRSESQQKTPDKKRLIQLIKEFAALFPEDRETTSYLALLRDKRRISVRLLLLTLIILVTTVGIFFIKHFSTKAIVTTKTDQPIKPLLPKLEAQKDEPLPLPQKQAEIVPPTGILKMNVPSDVRVFIDGIRHSSSNLRSLRLSAGQHQVLMERDNFLPIERTILIKKSGITKVQTSEQNNE